MSAVTCHSFPRTLQPSIGFVSVIGGRSDAIEVTVALT